MSTPRGKKSRVLLDKMNMNMTLSESADTDQSNKKNRGRTTGADAPSTATITIKSRGRDRKRAVSEPPTSSRLLLSNLEKGVTDQDLEELLEAVGKLRSVSLMTNTVAAYNGVSFCTYLFVRFRVVRLHFDEKGRSAGSAEIEFEADSDARKAVEKYDGVTLDGRPLRFEYLVPRPTSKRIKNVRKK